jgi:hypothetical protein
MATITLETYAYNQRRYGKPWIARVDFSSSSRGDFAWGEWAGDHMNGGAGVLSVNVNPGDIVAKGQKDFRNEKNSAAEFFIVLPDLTLNSLGDKGSAYKHYLATKSQAPDREALIYERASLVARISEIDALLA